MKKILILQIPIFIFSLFFAQEVFAYCSERAEVTITLKDSEGKFIPNARFQIYEQITDIDGNKKIGSSVASGVINEVLGSDDVSIRSDNGKFVIKAWGENTRDRDKGSFYFFDQNINCGEEKIISLKLSAFKFIIRDTKGELKTGQDFSVYIQDTDADGDPVRGDLMGDLEIPEKWYETIYLPSQSRTINKENYRYIFEAKSKYEETYKLENIIISDQRTFKIEYVFSDILINLKDENKIPLPENTSIDIYKQEKDIDEEKALGERITTLKTDNNGKVIFEHPEGTYAAKVTYQDKKTETFWNLKISDQIRKEYILVAHEEENVGQNLCSELSELNIIAKDMQGNLIEGLSVEVFSQEIDANGNDVAGESVKLEKLDENGSAKIIFKPNPRKKYAVKFHEKNKNVGDYWFFNTTQFKCKENKTVTKYLPKIKLILRDGAGKLKKNQKFSIYTQKFDADGEPIKEKKDLVYSNFSTNELGYANIYVAPSHPNILEKRGTYVLATKGENNTDFEEYNIRVETTKDTIFEYTLSDLFVTLKNAYDETLADTRIDLYEQSQSVQGEYLLGRDLGSFITDAKGQAIIEYPAGTYILTTKDYVRKDIIFEQIKIRNNKRTYKTIQTNVVKIGIIDKDGKLANPGEMIKIYKMLEGDDGLFYEDKLLKSSRTEADGYIKMPLAPGPYLFKYTESDTQRGIAAYLENEKQYSFSIDIRKNNIVMPGKSFKLKKPEKKTQDSKLKGRILLQVEAHGEAWYVNPNDSKRYYMKNGTIAYNMMRNFGLGITNIDLKKIPIGIDNRLEEQDSDNDGLHDKMEEALGTDPNNPDSDSDTYPDGHEIKNGYSPLGPGKLSSDINFSNKLKGKILLQVESKGEAWYINPEDGKRYYMKDGDSAYEIMRFLSLGITNSDLEDIEEGEIE